MAICPYCREEITKDDVSYFYNDENHFFSKPLREEFLGQTDVSGVIETIFKKHGDSRSRYFAYWTNRFHLDPNMVQKSTNGITLKRKEVNVTMNTMDEEELVKTKAKELRPNVYQIAEFEIDLCYVNPERADASPVPLIKRSGFGACLPCALVCPRCENMLPLDYFDKDCINIILTGFSSVGKTAFVMAMLQNAFVNLTGKAGGLKITRNMENCDVCGDQFVKELNRFNAAGELPRGTNRPLPPIFLSFEWTLPDRTVYRHTLCLIDTEGERWDRESNKSSIAPLIDQCDGMLYLVEPSQWNCPETPQPVAKSGGAPSRGSHAGLRMARLTPQVSDTDDRNEAKKGTASYIYETFFDVENDLYQRMSCAFVLSKLDRYLESGKYRGVIDTDKIPFWHELVTYDDESRSRKRTCLFDAERATYHSIAAYELLHTYFRMPTAQNCSFGKTQWFAVSSFCGEAKRREQDGKAYVTHEQQENTLHIHEPLMWLLSEIVPQKIARRRAAEEARARREENVFHNVGFEQ